MSSHDDTYMRTYLRIFAFAFVCKSPACGYEFGCEIAFAWYMSEINTKVNIYVIEFAKYRQINGLNKSYYYWTARMTDGSNASWESIVKEERNVRSRSAFDWKIYTGLYVIM